MFAGHTHSPIDQNFGVVHRAISRANFIASTVAMQELLKVAHDIAEEKNKNTRITEVINLDIYHDYVNFYDPVMNHLIHNFQAPHRYKIEFLKQWGFSDCQYMFQSPDSGFENTWLPCRPIPGEDSLEKTANIEFPPCSSFGGKESMAKTLEVDPSANFGAMLDASNKVQSAANKFAEVSKAMPSIESLERAAFAEQISRMEVEADVGKAPKKAPHRIVVTKKMVADIEANLLSKNTSKAGHILFIKRSNCSDPDWLSKRPNVLPNPKYWREQAANTKEVDVASILAVSIDESSQTKRRHRTKDEIEHDNAITNTLKFNSNASNMVKAAKHMLELSTHDVLISKSESMDIIKATRCFHLPVVTARDEIFLKNVSSVSLITKATEIRVAEAEREPWQLLRLPPMELVEKRRAKVKKEQHEAYE